MNCQSLWLFILDNILSMANFWRTFGGGMSANTSWNKSRGTV